MKKLILSLVATSIIAAPAAAAPNLGQYGGDRHGQSVRDRDGRSDRVQLRKVNKVTDVRNVHASKWRKGQQFDRRHASRYAVIHNPRAYGLHAAPRGYRWVRSDNDAILVGIAGGIIGAVIASAF